MFFFPPVSANQYILLCSVGALFLSCRSVFLLYSSTSRKGDKGGQMCGALWAAVDGGRPTVRKSFMLLGHLQYNATVGGASYMNHSFHRFISIISPMVLKKYHNVALGRMWGLHFFTCQRQSYNKYASVLVFSATPDHHPIEKYYPFINSFGTSPLPIAKLYDMQYQNPPFKNTHLLYNINHLIRKAKY